MNYLPQIKAFAKSPHTIKNILYLILLMVLGLGISNKNSYGQSRGNLTPDAAESIIVHSPQYSELKLKLPIHEEGFLKGHEQGMWTGGILERDDLFTTATGDQVQLTDRGKAFFQSIEINPGKGNTIMLKRPIEPIFKILSIQSSVKNPEWMEVSFSWGYEELPAIAKRFVVEGGEGNATIKPTAEGWQMDRIHFQFSRAPAPLSRAEKAEEEKDTSQFKAFREQELKKKEEEKKRVGALLREAKSPTRQIAEFKFDFSTLNVSTRLKRSYQFKAKISDVDIQVDGIERVGSEQFNHSYSLWFNHVRDISKGYDETLKQHWVKIKSKYGKIAYWASRDQGLMNEVYNTLISAHKNWQEKYGEAAKRFPG